MSDPIAPLIDALHKQGRLRVWSLIITVFGDLVQHRGGEISTTRLGLLLDRVGVERGALRTALSRLGRDGWVTSTRRGRSSVYRLSPEGLARFAPATTRIYAAPPPGDITNWAVDIRLLENGVPRITLGPAGATSDPADLRLSGTLDQISPVFRDTFLDPAHRLALMGLRRDLVALEQAQIDRPLDAAAARILLIHRWRRIVLRYADILPDLMPLNTPIADPRRGVAEAYGRLVPLAEAWLDSSESDLGAMPKADPAFARRFGARERT